MRNSLILSLALTLALSAAAGELAGVTLPDQASVSGQALVLNGLALRKRFVVKVYVAGLYLPQKRSDAGAILAADEPRQMRMHFVYSVSREQVCEGWDEGLALNTPGASAELKAQFQELCGMMEEVPKGQALSFTYVPGTGTTVEVKGKTKGTIPGKAFADALLASWIGPDPAPGAGFKKALLGG
jgi:hypothetical protein